ncbi:MAG: hypothetical protein Q8P86_00825 [bacterium]|nr:hypothetical protein [bacterium]
MGTITPESGVMVPICLDVYIATYPKKGKIGQGSRIGAGGKGNADLKKNFRKTRKSCSTLSYEIGFLTKKSDFERAEVKNFEFNARGIDEKFLTRCSRNMGFSAEISYFVTQGVA